MRCGRGLKLVGVMSAQVSMSGLNADRVTLYCDATHEGLWFQGLVPELRHAEIRKMGNRVHNPRVVNALLAYDRPDIILVKDGAPLLVLEKTSECPTGHNIGQRVGRIVRAAEHDVPSITFLPFDARKHGKHAGIVNLNARLLDAFLRMARIHGTPVLAVNWPCDDRGELIRDGSQDGDLSGTLREFVESGFDAQCNAFHSTMEAMRAEYEARVTKYPGYAKPPRSVKIVNTEDFVELMRERDPSFEPGHGLGTRRETVIYTADMSPDACRREDPYTGMQFVYDYQLCRSGPHPSDKRRNLVINVPRVSISRWRDANPNDPLRKSSLWYTTANGIALKDGFIRAVS